MSSLSRKFKTAISFPRRMFTRANGFLSYYDSRLVRLVSILLGLVLFFLVVGTFMTIDDSAVRSHIFCFRSKEESFPDISLEPPATDKSIFFIDTSCISFLKKKTFISTRQLCVIEAAAKLHPNYDVYVLFTSPGILKFDGRKRYNQALKILLEYDNIKLKRIYYDQYLLNTPLESFVKNRIPYDSIYSHIQANHILRIVTLWKYGGIFLDLNILVLKNLQNLALNYIGMNRKAFGNDVLKIGSSNGRKMLESIMKSMKVNYNPQICDSLGSDAIYPALPRSCRRVGDDMDDCEYQLKVYPSTQFYPNDQVDWIDFFKEGDFKMMNLINSSYTMKNWNIHIAGNVTENMVYGKLAKKLCPKVYEISGGVFG